MRKVLFILGELNDRDLDWMLTIGSRQEIAAGTVLIEEGKPTDALYIVLEGTLTVSMAALGNREISTIGCGEVLGEMSFVDDRPPAATVKAIEDSVVLSIPRQPLTEKLQLDVLFALRFYRAITKFLSTRLRGAVNWFSDDKDLRMSHQQDDDLAALPPHDMALATARFDQLLERLKNS
ncbi:MULTISPECIES: cyclic nucleotide-binding domain-containing protein [unclassified Microcoleus]|uniref:cyclic nucleotide-binding domain-containing protein n=1 Tax=unclassified Microcoleus TaxID=2642155 RepID=UPI001687F270|nr:MULTISPECIES: cyclic nucleotide-binding domain-containing protein [unclassified Microcoleus]MBD1938228.1 cyclic nucleotide-binding domain-containing protein [Microcoleus sp. FACHB-68]MBD2040723.1 cyclic nucleotide-binding domain-containing protein [Microcoleus sp. FACHB-672]